MRVDPTHWGPHSREKLLCGCCDGVVYESNSFYQIFNYIFKNRYFKSYILKLLFLNRIFFKLQIQTDVSSSEEGYLSHFII
jgi:hypothetical protein